MELEALGIIEKTRKIKKDRKKEKRLRKAARLAESARMAFDMMNGPSVLDPTAVITRFVNPLRSSHFFLF